jgi:hypothetical protein
MAEIKRTFTAARMNKDLDERLIARGEYRDAMNIQIRTTDGDAAGTVQNIQGNAPTYYASNSSFNGGHITTSLKNANIKTKCIGSVADERNNKAYFLFASPKIEFDSASDITGTTRFTDYILEQDSEGGFLPVVVDQWGIVETYSDFNGSFNFNANSNFITSTLGSKYRVGMSVQAYTSTGVAMMKQGTKIVKIDGNNLFLNKDHVANSSTCSYLIFTHPKALGFNYDVLVTGINVIDDFLFYTTNVSEPKKINIPRCKAGTTSTLSHTKLKINESTNSNNLISYPGLNEEVGLIPSSTGDLLEEHITVIRKAPLEAPKLIMSSEDREGTNSYSFTLTDQNFSNAVVGEFITVDIPDGVDLNEGDYVNLTCTNDLADDNISTIRAFVENAGEFPGIILLKILSISSDITASNTEWFLELEQQDKPLFELKFPRFAYRYKYNDGEYSSFSPFSEIAFLPGKFDYEPKKGYNLGMVNNLRQLKITNILADDRVKPDDISCIDILYKSTDSPVVYVIKTVEKNIDPEWSTLNTGFLSDINITSDMVHKVVPSDQILRSWDNVPRFAKAQEIVANRLIYGNYVQGYDDDFTVSINQRLISENITQNLTPEKSVKSLRTYKFGLVYGDKYGRETPVISVGQRVTATKQTVENKTDDTVTVPKKQSDRVNHFAVKQSFSSGLLSSKSIKSWMDYVKYYIKETSTEYYNMVMDRWYNAEDGNVWISFSSSDRNKVDEETYLILKNENGNDVFVPEEARYKILAIANEAPDFIKTQGRIIGGPAVEEDETNHTQNTDGIYQPLTLMTSLIFGLNDFEVPEAKGVLRVRIKAVGADNTYYTGYRTVTRVQNVSDDDGINSGEIQIDSPFGDEANFPQIFVQSGDYNNTNQAQGALVYFLEFRDDVVENKPEFDGRFFVKILRDNTLESKVMNLSALENASVYSIIKTIGFDYIDTTSFVNPATTGVRASYEFSNNSSVPTNDVTGSNVATRFARVYDGDYGPLNTFTAAFWSAREDNQGSSIFIDAAQSPGFNSIYSQYNLHVDFPATDDLRGFAKSGDLDVLSNTYDRIYFSAFAPPFFTQAGSVSNNEFFNLMTTQGTLFRFRNDPNGAVYKVVEGNASTDGARMANYHNGQNQPSSFGNTVSNRTRSSFYTTFRKLDPETGLITNEGINFNHWDPRGDMRHDGSETRQLDIVQKTDIYNGNLTPSSKAAIWETEPKDSTDLDIYYEASNAIPMRLNYNNTPLFAPVGSVVTVVRNSVDVDLGTTVVVGECLDKGVKLVAQNTNTPFTSVPILVNDTIIFTHADGTKTKTKVINWLDATAADLGVIKTITATFSLVASHFGAVGSSKLAPINGLSNEQNGLVDDMSIAGGNLPAGTFIHNPGATANFFTVTNSSDTPVVVGPSGTNEADNTTYTLNSASATGYYLLDANVYNYEVHLPWFNCYSFGNGVESNRIRDDFNAPSIDNGVNVSTVLSDYKSEHRQNSMIYSGIYNSNSSVNNLNEFNMSQKITKDLNPAYGSIQALKTRDTDLITFTEDKVLRVLANKDALFNADGKSNITATDRVLGQATPYIGDYGISKNPESLAFDQYRIYFTDKQRGAVLRLSRDGLTPISDVGMRTWFRDNLHKSNQLIGSFDTVSGEYNISIKYIDAYLSSEYTNTTVSFNESGKGWVSFKSFVADSGVSVSGNYFTCNINSIYRHHVDINTQGNPVIRNNFYGDATKHSTITTIFNEQPSVVKNFKTLNYEGSEGKKITINQMPVTSPSGVSAGNLSDDSYNALLDTSGALFITSGWSFSSIVTDLQSGKAEYVKQKEGKWFSNVNGEFSATDISSIDESEFNVQGLGTASTAPVYSTGSQLLYTITVDGNG